VARETPASAAISTKVTRDLRTSAIGALDRSSLFLMESESRRKLSFDEKVGNHWIDLGSWAFGGDVAPSAHR